MNYELAKELKDAGFPQDGKEGLYVDFEGKVEFEGDPKNPKIEDLFYCPTLSELIEACGDKFIQLEKSLNWWAIGEDEPLEPQQYEGNTPEEAVARLWLALNKK